MKEQNIDIELLREVLDYNPETGVFKWRICKSLRIKVGDIAGTIDKLGYRRIRVKGIKYSAARLAWLYFYGKWPQFEIDHKNRIRNDNRILNLREATRSQNIANQRCRKDSKSKIKGIWKADKKWCARVIVNGKIIYLGRFNSSEEASNAYKAAASNVFGEFANA